MKIYILPLLGAFLYGMCDNKALKLVNSYKAIKECKDNYIILHNGKKFLYDDGKKKSFQERLNNPDIEDMLKFIYPKGWVRPANKDYDPGRIRFEPLFKALYGGSADEVRKNLVYIKWIDGSNILVTKKEGVSEALKKIVKELKALPPNYSSYLKPIGGTFKWRKIAGTNRLSFHSFGTAIDINVKHANYWRWGGEYKNSIPKKIVEIFEKHGFIWGGKWYHFDTMHFEYRPELLK
ncbi:MAG: M15 family metallopeptidase [Epsilonproteobacteria bacterium]|nr:M15 family metallopeptidase [Campylobacterota bacterium]